MHLAQAKTRLPEGKRIHCKLGCCCLLMVGLYLSALNLTRRQTIIDFLSQIAQCLGICLMLAENFNFINDMIK